MLDGDVLPTCIARFLPAVFSRKRQMPTDISDIVTANRKTSHLIGTVFLYGEISGTASMNIHQKSHMKTEWIAMM